MPLTNRMRTPEQVDYEARQAEQEAYSRYLTQQNLQLQGYALDVSMANQAYQNAAQKVYNRNAMAQARQGAAASRYGLAQDMASLGLQAARAKGDLATQNAMNDMSIAQQRLGNARYVQGLDQDIQRTRYTQATTQVPGSFSIARRLMGY